MWHSSAQRGEALTSHPSRITDLRTGDVLLAEGTVVTIPMEHGQTLLLQVDEEP